MEKQASHAYESPRRCRSNSSMSKQEVVFTVLAVRILLLPGGPGKGLLPNFHLPDHLFNWGDLERVFQSARHIR